MAKKDLFDSIDVPEPCSQSWEAMKGGDQSRFCDSCEKDIYNLSEMTRREAKKLIFQSKESVCIRLEKDTRGKVKTLKKQLHQITRRLPIAAGVLAASLTMTSAADAQRRPPVGKVALNNILDSESTASILGTITDETGAVIPNAQIVLFDAKNKIVQKTKSNEEGFYELKNIKAGVYKLEIEALPFKKFSQNKLKFRADEKIELKVKLEAPKSELIGDITIIEPTENKKNKINDKNQTRKIESLPVNDRKESPVLGLFPAAKSKSNEQ